MKTCILSFSALLLFSFAKAQTAEDVVAKHVEAIGGKDKLSQIKSVYIENKADVMGNESQSKATLLNGKGYKSEMDFNGQQIVQVITDKGGWAINPFAGSSDAQAVPPDQYKTIEDGIYFPDPLYNYAEHGAKVELLGQEKIDTINAFKLKYTNKDSSEITYYIDPSTWYIIEALKKGNVQGQDIEIKTTYSNYKKTDFGVSVPSSTSVDMGQFALNINQTNLEINKDVDPAIFEMPK